MTSVGIDVSKGKSTVCFLRPYGEVIASPYEVQHSELEIKKLISCIRESFKDDGLESRHSVPDSLDKYR